MTTVPPSNPALPQMLAAAAAGMNTGTIIRPPPAIAALPPGSTITGTVSPSSGPDPRVVTVSTATGDVQLRTPTPLPDGATVGVEVVRASPAQVNVRLVTLDGQPLQQALAQLARPQASPDPPPAPPPQTTALPTAPGTPTPLPVGFAWSAAGPQPAVTFPPISAYVVAGPEQTAVSTAVTPLPIANTAALLSTPGTELSLRIVAVTLPTTPFTSATTPDVPSVAAATPTPMETAAATTAPLPADPAAASSPPGTTSAPATAPRTTPGTTPYAPPALTSSAPQTLALPSSTSAAAGAPASMPSPTAPLPSAPSGTAPPEEFQDNADIVLTPRGNAPLATPTPPMTVVTAAPLATITATVILSQDGVPLVQTAEGQIQLNMRANLPPGTVVVLEVAAHQAPTPGTIPLPPMPSQAQLPLAAAGIGWPTLSEAVQLLQRVDPAMGAQLAGVIPDGGSRTALAMMAYVQSMRSGETRQWPGDSSLRALERAGPRGAHLAAQLTDEVGALSRQVREAPGDWRALPLPWQSEGRIERVRLVLREVDPNEEAEKKKGGGGTRFLVDLDLSRFGPLQLDGMFRRENRSLDMMIRTHAPLSETMRQDLAGLFANANAAMNMAGGLSFQVVKKFPDPLTAPATGRDKSGLWV